MRSRLTLIPMGLGWYSATLERETRHCRQVIMPSQFVESSACGMFHELDMREAFGVKGLMFFRFGVLCSLMFFSLR